MLGKLANIRNIENLCLYNCVGVDCECPGEYNQT